MIYYYDDAGNIYPTKNDALKSNKNCQFYYRDNEYELIDWSKEPKESLQELYKQRALQIRDEHDYVVICYSGGIDSSQVLESFYYNNIHIDEILVVGALSQDSQKYSDENHNGDLYYNAFPLLNKLNLPNTKISIIDYTDIFRDPLKFTLLKKFGPEYVNHIGSRTSVHNLFWYDMDKFLSHNKGNIAYVMGKDKPLVRYDGKIGKYYFVLNDMPFTDYGNRYEYNFGKRINFYSDPEAFKIILKQCFLIQQFEIKKQFKLNSSCFDATFKDSDSYVENIKNIIYNLKHPLNYETKKSKTPFLSKRDMFMLNKQNSKIFEYYINGLKILNKDIINQNPKRSLINTKRYYFG